MNSSVLSHSVMNFGTSLAAGLSAQAREPLGFAAFRTAHLELIQGTNAVGIVPTGRNKLTLLCFAPQRLASAGVTTPPTPPLALTQAGEPPMGPLPIAPLARVTPLLPRASNDPLSLRPRVLQARSPEHKQTLLEELLAREPGAVLVCTATVRSAKAVFARLARAGFAVGVCHGELHARARDTTRDAFMDGRYRILVATQAFAAHLGNAGALLVHYDLPASIEGDARAAGGASGEGSPADSVLLYCAADERRQRYFLLHQVSPRRAAHAWATWLSAQPANTRLDFTALHEVLAQHWAQVFTRSLCNNGTLQRCPGGFSLTRGVEYEALHAELKIIYKRHRRAARRTLEKLLAACGQRSCCKDAVASAADL